MMFSRLSVSANNERNRTQVVQEVFKTVFFVAKRKCIEHHMVVAMLFSHLGLCLLVAGYASIGAVMFSALERPFEMTRQGRIKNETEKVAQRIMDYTYSVEFLVYEDFIEAAENIFKEFEKQVVRAATTEGYTGDDDNQKLQWSFTGALFYSFTVITTIGYGNIVPKTDWGKVATIFYATIGIPLMLMCLAKIAETLASIFTFLYFRVCCAYCLWKEKRRIRLRRAATITARTYQATNLKRGLSMKQPAKDYFNRRAGSFRREVYKKHSTVAQPKQSRADPRWDTRWSLPDRRGQSLKRQNTVAISPGRASRKATIKKTESMRTTSPQHSYITHAATLPSSLKTSQGGKKQTASSLYPHKPGCEATSKGTKRGCKCSSVCWSPHIQESPSTPDDRLLGPSGYMKTDISMDSGTLMSDDRQSKQPLVERLSVDSMDKSVPSIIVSDPNHNDTPPRVKGSSSAYLTDMTSEDDDLTVMGESYTSRTQDSIVMLSEDHSLVTIHSKRSAADSDDKSIRSASRSAHGSNAYGEDQKMPVSVGIITLIAFVLGGAILFSIWEDWTLFRAAYFCFITLTTIGFGDIVPRNSASQDRQDVLIMNTLYLLVGMALIAMCFKLMQDDVVQKTRWLGQKIGLLAKDTPDYWWEDWDDSDEESDDEGPVVAEDKHTTSSGSEDRRSAGRGSNRSRR